MMLGDAELNAVTMVAWLMLVANGEAVIKHPLIWVIISYFEISYYRPLTTGGDKNWELAATAVLLILVDAGGDVNSIALAVLILVDATVGKVFSLVDSDFSESLSATASSALG